MQSRALVLTLCLAVNMILAVAARASTIFAGSFSTLSVDSSLKDISINYPRQGEKGLCGVELKADLIVLSTSAWQRLSDVLEVRELHDGELGKIVKARIESNYSPTLRYVFSNFNSDFGSLRFKSKNGQSLQRQINAALTGDEGDVNVIVVSYTCP